MNTLTRKAGITSIDVYDSDRNQPSQDVFVHYLAGGPFSSESPAVP